MSPPLQRQPGATGLQRRRLLGMGSGLGAWWLALPLLGLGGQTAWAQPATPDQPPNAAVRQARARLDRLTALVDQAERLARQTSALQQRLAGLADDTTSTTATERAASAALDGLRAQALPNLHQAHQAWLAAADQVQRGVLAHQAALAALQQAAPAQRSAAMLQADASAASRAQAERRLAPARQAAIQAASAGRTAAAGSATRTQDLLQRSADLAAGLRSAASGWAALHQGWRTLQVDANRAAPGLLPTQLLPQATAPWSPPAPPPPLAALDAQAPLQALQAADTAVQQANQGLWQRADATGFVQTTLSGGCSGDLCAAWQQELQTLAHEQATLRTALAAAQARQTEAWRQADVLPADLLVRLQAGRDRLAGLAVALAAAAGPGQQALQIAGQVVDQTLHRLQAAQRQAEASFAAAWRAQYGSEPPLDLEATSAGQHAGAAPPAPAAAAMWRPLERHALHRMHQRNDEPEGFGAYTYVLVGTSVGQSSPGVRQRLQRLLGALRQLPTADELPAAQRIVANLFVVPSPAGSENQTELVYDLRLGQALMAHVPPGLQLGAATRRALTAGNGPFLITLPGRLADARADWPLLFADLSALPDAVVVDVVRSYMGDLLGDFKASNATWQPPALQRVALTLVRLVQGTGDLVQAVFPAAMAAPASR